MSNNELFKDLINQQLSSVEFVQDYLSLHFDGIILTYYLWPIVRIGQDYLFENIDYKNRLCEFITKRVEAIFFEEENKLELKFPNECSISISLKRFGNNLDIPEFLYYHDAGDKWFVLD
jgi:hypothetical protein